MNKDVIYVEPEDDITDIITKIENSKERIVALVPPKKAGVFRSIVNIKLITKAGANADKAVVLVTTDPSIIKLAAATKLPVTKNLQSAPAVPELEEDSAETTTTEEVVAEPSDGEKADTADEPAAESATSGNGEDKTDSDDKGSKDSKGAAQNPSDKKTKKDKKPREHTGNPVKDWFVNHKKLAIFGSIGIVALAVLLVWALVIAPAVVVTVGIRTTQANFSETATFTDKLAEENVSEGKFYLEEKKIESKSEVEFTATGKKNVGEKAQGEVVVYTYFKDKGTVAIDAGAVFTNDGLSYTADKEVSISWNKTDMKVCENNGEPSLVTSGCMVSARVPVTAVGSGANYNIAAAASGWSTTANVGVYSDKAMAGGTDKTLTVVQQSDIDAALTKIKDSNEAANKAKLYDTVEEGDFIIEASFKQTTGDAVSTPAVGEEVEEGKKAKLSVTTTDSVYVIDNTKVEEFIKAKAKLADNYAIYSMNDPFVENFTKTDAGYTGKIKTSYVSGPRITENSVVEMIRGKGLGVAQHDLKDVDGVSSIRIDTSYPWVMSIPSDPNKITVILDVQE